MAALRVAEMLTQEQAVEMWVLKKQGRSIRQIAREMGMARNTVRRYLREQRKARYGPRKARTCKLDAYKGFLQERVGQAKPDWIPATVLLREIQAVGYVGGISQLKAYLAPMKAVAPDPVVRFETEPGRQMQADFTVIRRGRDRLSAFVATLGYSRATFVRFTEREDFPIWRDCLQAAFEYFGGVPQEVLFDNAKPVIIERDAYGPGRHRWHAGMLQFARDYSFQLRVCRPYRARTKGKVERFNGYLKQSFLVPLVATLKAGGLKLDLDTANREVLRWLAQVANVRVHGTTGEPPSVRLPTEQARLTVLPVCNQDISVPGSHAHIIPVESLQHPLSTYQALLEVMV
ncbi:MAG: IS21-like element ISPsy4 family transposase [Steroidobacteraceae bacterium]